MRRLHFTLIDAELFHVKVLLFNGVLEKDIVQIEFSLFDLF